MKFVLTGKYLEIADVRGGIPHHGIDLAMQEGTTLRSVVDGTVRLADYGTQNAGKTVMIEGDNGNTYIYGHLHDFVAKNGQHVRIGDVIGHSGNTGHSTAEHLHFGMKNPQGYWVDPTSMGEQVANMSGNHNWLVDKWNQAGDWVVDRELELILKPIGAFLKELTIQTWHWFILNLPDIIGYTAIGSGVMIILSAMMGRGILKPLGWFMSAFILAACILGGGKS